MSALPLRQFALTHRRRRTYDFTVEGVNVVRGCSQGVWGKEVPPVESRGKAPIEGLGDEVPQKLKQNVKLAYNF